MQWGPVSVSAVSIITFSKDTPRTSAAICAITVFNPCPKSVDDKEITKVPVVVEWIKA